MMYSVADVAMEVCERVGTSGMTLGVVEVISIARVPFVVKYGKCTGSLYMLIG